MTGIRLDRRARVPFALVGVLLLVSSVAYASGLAAQGPIGADRSVERAMERADADATPTIRAAAATAARDAAAEPVTNASGDRPAVREESAFEDALRIRVAVRVAAALDGHETRHDDVTASVSTPAVESDSLVEARERVAVEPAANGTALRVTVRNVTTTATRDGRVVARESGARTVVVAVPVFAAHDRTERYERRLNRGPTEGPGLGRQLTARLYPVTWARGAAQYGGAPVQNVLANRHVELSTNAANAQLQRATFGAADPDATAGVRRATAETGLRDLLAVTDLDDDSWNDAVLAAPAGDLPAEPEPDRGTTTVEVGDAADTAYGTVVEDLDALARDAYRVEASLATDAEQVEAGSRPPPSPPGPNWTLGGESTATSHAVSGRGGDQGFGTASRTVRADHTVTRTWTNGTARTTTEASWTDRYRVSITVSGDYAPRAGAPDRSTDTFTPGGPLDGRNLADAPRSARRALDATDADRVARETVRDGDRAAETVVYGDRPAGIDDWIARDLAALHGEIRAIETEAAMDDAATGAADPYGDLADALRDRRTELVDAPERYDGAADRARVAARAAFVDETIAELEAASEADAAASRDLDAFVAGGDLGVESVGEVVEARDDAPEPEPYELGPGGPGGSVALEPDGDPGYLPRTRVDGVHVEAVEAGEGVHPLATRNLNYATVPYGDAAGSIVDRLLGREDAVRLHTAGETLLAADRALAADPDPELRSHREALARELDAALADVEVAANGALRRHTGLSANERRAVLDAAAERFDSTGERAVAAEDGRYGDAVTEEAASRADLDAAERTRLRIAVRNDVRTVTGRDAVGVPEPLVDDAVSVTRTVARDRMEAAVEDGIEAGGKEAAERWATEPIRAAGAGLPVAPLPGKWYATVNAWRVEVRGAYPAFTLRTDTGPSGEPFEYVREPGTVTVDVDGEPVVLGRTDPVSFESGTVVVVAVPPGPPGVGDVDGTRDETSDGWPCPDGAEEVCRD